MSRTSTILRFFMAAALMPLLAAGTAFAHEGGSHLSGTVTAVDAKANTVTVQDGKQTTTITLLKSTKYVKDKKSAAVADLKAGLRVVVHVKMDEKTKTYTAEEVEIGVADASAKPAAAAVTTAPPAAAKK